MTEDEFKIQVLPVKDKLFRLAVTLLNDRAEAEDTVQAIEQKESLQHIHDIIKRLPARQRLILHLRDIEQYDYDEIETMTDMSRNNIRVTLSRARKKIKKAYSKIQGYEQ